MKKFFKGLLIDMLIVCIPLSFAIGLVAGYDAQNRGSEERLIDVVKSIREVPEYKRIAVWYQIPSKKYWVECTGINILSGTVSNINEPMKGSWQGKRAIKLVCERFDGGVDEIPLTHSIKEG